jgi:hypothetical protein
MFPEATFGPPCTEAQIALAEKRLGHALPPVLVELYREFDGFLGPTNAQFFYPLCDAPTDMSASLVAHTLFLRGEDYFPAFMKSAVAVGDMGTGPCWLIFLAEPARVALWDAEWGDDHESLEGDIVDVWQAAKLVYESLPQGS